MPPEQNSEHLHIRITPTLKRAVERAAAKDHMTVPDWTRTVVAAAVISGAFRKPRRKGGVR